MAHDEEWAKKIAYKFACDDFDGENTLIEPSDIEEAEMILGEDFEYTGRQMLLNPSNHDHWKENE